MKKQKKEERVQIEQKMIKVITKIVVDGKKYPIHVWNMRIAGKYLLSGDEKHLENLKDFSLEF